jgi:hypothetical protein
MEVMCVQEGSYLEVHSQKVLILITISMRI